MINCHFTNTSSTYSMSGSVVAARYTAAAVTKSLQSCPTLCDPIDGSPPGSPIPEILQARALEWVDISFSNAWKWKVSVRLLATSWSAAYQAPPSMGFSRQEYWSGLPLPSPKLDIHSGAKIETNACHGCFIKEKMVIKLT